MTALSPTLTALLRGILVDPADITARLVYADCLDEHSQHERAELIRVQVEMSRYRRIREEWDERRKTRPFMLPFAGNCDCNYLLKEHRPCTFCVTRYREHSLFRFMGTPGFFSELPGDYRTADAPRSQITTADGITYDIANGFVSRVSLSTSLFLTHAAALFAAHPLTSVTLTDREPATGGTVTGSSHGWWRATIGIDESSGQERDLVPASLWEVIQSRETPSRWKLFPTRLLALSALSFACVSYGRSLASLPPLNDNAPAI